MTEEQFNGAKEIKHIGFTFLVDESGETRFTPINVTNHFELVGLIDYVYKLKENTLSLLTNSSEVKSEKALVQLCDALIGLTQKEAHHTNTAE